MNEITFEWWVAASKDHVSVSVLLTGEGIFVESHAAFAKEKVNHVLMEDMRATIFLPYGKSFHVQLAEVTQEDHFKANHGAISAFYDDLMGALFWHDQYKGHKKATVFAEKPGVNLG